MHFEDGVTPCSVGPVDDDLPVEPAGTEQGRIENVWPVGRSDEDNVVLQLEAVHLDEQLVERLLALVMAAAQARAPVAPDGVDLIHEHDAWGRLLGLLEEVADPRGADPNEHLDEVRPGDAEERHARLARDGPGQQGLAGSRGSVQQNSLGNAGPERLELLRVLEELLDLLELCNSLCGARDVTERDLRRVGRHALRLRLAE